MCLPVGLRLNPLAFSRAPTITRGQPSPLRMCEETMRDTARVAARRSMIKQVREQRRIDLLKVEKGRRKTKKKTSSGRTSRSLRLMWLYSFFSLRFCFSFPTLHYTQHPPHQTTPLINTTHPPTHPPTLQSPTTNSKKKGKERKKRLLPPTHPPTYYCFLIKNLLCLVHRGERRCPSHVNHGCNACIGRWVGGWVGG